ncbi:nitronate monooxygenase [Sphingobium sp. HBC34]|uniref:Propionate 3-nitronate monooxygenase n=1 Tax=Sphingobium cyanobacteriorum TaxID=3063954 RepID=A0ABT8ZNS9_9SPHN|nr:nitronate monooxygenase [Sphingobium sp. HBC34]MDO7836192.1 nitronate monooxygenase [Sphingobium sp. HBC34]
MNPLDSLGLSVPIIQAPMAGTSTPDMAAAVSNAGALGSIALGAVDAPAARAMIDAVRARTDRPFNVNLFVHTPAQAKPDVEQRWIAALAPLFAQYGAKPPPALREIYPSFAVDDAMLAMLLDAKPAIVSFHFGLPDARRITALKGAGCLLLATATSLDEALAAKAAGIDAIVAQGFEAGGHRGMFDPQAPDACLGTMVLARLLVARCGLPVIAAGGIMDGRGVRAALALGAIAAQLGTAFIACPESSADAAYRSALFSPVACQTMMVSAISGRPTRCLANSFTLWAAAQDAQTPDYPIAYDAGKALNQAARAAGEYGYGAQWAGQGAPLARCLPAADLIATLVAEMRA